MQNFEKEMWSGVAAGASSKGALHTRNIGIRVPERYIMLMKERQLSPAKIAVHAFRMALEAIGCDVNTPLDDETYSTGLDYQGKPARMTWGQHRDELRRKQEEEESRRPLAPEERAGA